MKTILLLCVTSIVLISCFNQSKFLVETDYSYQGNFKKYTSFNFVKDTKLNEDTSVNYSALEEAIKSQMQVHGYKFTEKKPSLLVFYKIFSDNLKYNGYYQPELNIWAKNQNEDETYEPIKYNLNDGTLLIQFVDAKNNQSVWQGYASGLMEVKSTQTEKYLKHAVRSIFDKYRMFVEGYLTKENQN